MKVGTLVVINIVLFVMTAIAAIGLLGFGVWVVIKLMQHFGVI